MDKKTIDRIILAAKIILILSVPLYVVINDKFGDLEVEDQPEAKFVGKEACIECHQSEYDDWKGSDHDKAMAHATDSTVLADFNDAILERDGLTHKFYKRDGKFYVWTDGATGEMEEFEVKYTFGYTPLQQFLVEFPGGRLQTLALTWNTKEGHWYHMADEVYAGQDIDHTNWLHWTNQAQNWNGMCADCHSTNLVKGYDAESDTYNTTFSEINVSCEACHGPASNHITWARKAEYARDNKGDMGLVIQTSGIDNKEFVDGCARCHARRGALGDFKHDENIFNHMIPTLPTEPSYHVDGQIKEEDYVYSSFTQSKMYMRDVACNDCHNPHSTKRHFEDNRLCTQCHRADDYDTPNHHHHKLKGEKGETLIADDGVVFGPGDGARCINCHMPAQFYMGVDYRNDHSFRIPRPDLTKEIGTPNACNQCHADETVDWAVDKVEEWHGTSRHGHYGLAFEEAKSGSEKGLEMLVSIWDSQAESYPEILKATAIEKLCRHYPNEEKSRSIIKEAIGNSHELIRLTALQNYIVDRPEAIDDVARMLNDDTKAIRMEAANRLQQVPQGNIPAKHKKRLKEVYGEYESSLRQNADFPNGKFTLANYYSVIGKTDEAEKFYLRAMKQDDQMHGYKINLALLYYNKGQLDKTEAIYKNYLKHVPEDGNIMYNYGLLLSELKRYDESLEMLIQASKYATENSRILVNIANMYEFKNDFKNADKYFKQSIDKDPENVNNYASVLQYYMRRGMQKESKDLARTMLKKFPDFPQRDQLQQIINQ